MQTRQYLSAAQRARLAALLPDLAAAALAQGDGRSERMIRSGFRHGGLIGWGVEQARFAPEIFRTEVFQACLRGSFRRSAKVDAPEFVRAPDLDQSSRAITRFRASRNDEEFELLVGDPSARGEIQADALVAERIVKIFRRLPRRMSATDLAEFLTMLARIATEDGDLSLEVRGRQVAASAGWFDSPAIVSAGDHYVLEHALPGIRPAELPQPDRENVYHQTVINWARMLFGDGIMHSYLRRDTIRVDGDRIGVSRWSGTKTAGPACAALMHSLLRSAFSPGAGDRADYRARTSELLADGLAVAGSMEDLTDFCIALLAEGTRLQLERPLMPNLFVEQSAGKDSGERPDIFRMLRQLVWIRDLGLSCDVADLASPWRVAARDIDA